MAIRNKNLNLIPILQALLKHESVAAASDEVGLSQPAMSGSLARLRDLLHDPLLVRVGRTMRLTPRAARLRKRLDEVCSQIELIFQSETFDPTTAVRSFNVAVPDYIAFLLTDKLLDRLAKEAPGIEIHFIDIPPETLMDDMENARVDLLVCGNFGHWNKLEREFLYREHYVVTAAEGHPLLGRATISVNDLQDYPCPAIRYPSMSSTPEVSRWQSGIAAVDFGSQISSMHQFNAILLSAKSPTIARTPATLAWRMAEVLPIKIIEMPNVETSFDTCMFWSATTTEAQEHIWLRSIIKEALAPYDTIGAAKHHILG